MILARVVGTVVATRKDPRLVSNKLLIARPQDPHGKSEGSYLVAVDTVDAGVDRINRDEITAFAFAVRVLGARDQQLVADEARILPGSDNGTDDTGQDHLMAWLN